MPRKRTRRQDPKDKAATDQFRLLRAASRIMKTNGSEPQMRIPTEKKAFKRGERIVPLLLSLFNNENGLARVTASQSLMNDRKVSRESEVVIQAMDLDVKVAEIRSLSVRMLGKVAGDVDAAMKERIAASLSSYINDKDAALRYNVIEAFADMENAAEGAAPFLLGVAKDGSNPESLRRAAFKTLASVSNWISVKVKKEIVDMFIDRLEDQCVGLQEDAACGLVEMKAEHTVTPLLEQLKLRVKSPEYRSDVVRILYAVASIDISVKERITACLEAIFLEGGQDPLVSFRLKETLDLLKLK